MPPHPRAFLVAAFEDNHMGDLAVAKRMIDAAVGAGADAVKLTVRDVNACYGADVLQQPYLDYPERGTTLGTVLRSFELGAGELAELRACAEGRAAFWGAPYDLDSLRLLEKVGVERWQLDPPVVSDATLLAAVAATRQPVTAVLGMATEQDVADILQAFPREDLEMLHCVVGRDVTTERTALGFIPELARRHGGPVGYMASDSTVASCAAAFALGARTIEAPFTLERSLRGPMHARSMDRETFSELARTLRALERSLASPAHRTIFAVEAEAYAEERKGLVAARDLRAGEVLTAEMLTTAAPARGLSARLLPRLLGQRLHYDLPAGRAITFGEVDPR